MKNKKSGSSQLWGMIIYELMGDGCMNGLWTNIHTESKKVMNEIARKKTVGDASDLTGEYYVSWIEAKGGPVSGTLKIESRITHYYLEWIVSGKVSFKGVGLQVAEKRLLVTYWDGETIGFPG
jgi:hypothetical protein